MDGGAERNMTAKHNQAVEDRCCTSRRIRAAGSNTIKEDVTNECGDFRT